MSANECVCMCMSMLCVLTSTNVHDSVCTYICLLFVGVHVHVYMHMHARVWWVWVCTSVRVPCSSLQYCLSSSSSTGARRNTTASTDSINVRSATSRKSNCWKNTLKTKLRLIRGHSNNTPFLFLSHHKVSNPLYSLLSCALLCCLYMRI